MSSQPDMEALHRSNPELAPADQSVVVAQLQEEKQNLLEMYAAFTKCSVEEAVLALTEFTDDKETKRLADLEKPLVPGAPQTQQPEVEEKSPVNQDAPAAILPEEAEFFGSSEGSKYYPMDTHEDTQIKLENRVYFRTENDAIAAGYKA